MSSHVHLFVLCPPASGSTALWQMLDTSPQVSTFPTEGQFIPEVRAHFGQEPGAQLPVQERWALKPPWQEVRAVWEDHWDLEKRVLLEKSPVNLAHALDIRDAFPDARFVIMYRNPYAWLEGVTRRHPNAGAYATDVLTAMWLQVMEKQKANIEALGSRAVHFSYEAFTEDCASALDRVLELVPELESLDPTRPVRVFEREIPITNLNAHQIRRLSRRRVTEATRVFAQRQDLLGHFGYDLLHPDPLWDVRALSANAVPFMRRVKRKLGSMVR